MPTLYATGMMTSPDFATAGYSMFWIFNRLEILWAALALTATIGWYQYQAKAIGPKALALALVMMAITMVSTYWLTPTMSALSLNLNALESVEAVPAAMNWMHGGYFSLECLKLTLGIGLGLMCCRQEAIALTPADAKS
ncbi:MAG: hypothetical protein VKJ64_02475 [Leptolyngbyaceae bacterium]|nr:hypothetical protein [Leptolyngbyaceae bacterium]